MLKIILMVIFNATASLGMLIAVIAGIDYLADGVTLFTNAGTVALYSLLASVVAFLATVGTAASFIGGRL
jgi:hypothetical protein